VRTDRHGEVNEHISETVFRERGRNANFYSRQACIDRGVMLLIIILCRYKNNREECKNNES
jgi:hypothetical protein